MDLRKLLRGKKKKKASPVTEVDKPDPPAAAVPQPNPPVTAARKSNQPIELGTIDYCNLTADGKHGDFDAALQAAAETGKPIFANFVEWSG